MRRKNEESMNEEQKEQYRKLINDIIEINPKGTSMRNHKKRRRLNDKIDETIEFLNTIKEEFNKNQNKTNP